MQKGEMGKEGGEDKRKEVLTGDKMMSLGESPKQIIKFQVLPPS